MTEKSRKQMFCAVYTRKSVEDGLEQEFNSLDAQREAAENYIASQRDNGWTLLPKRYDDGGYSGGNTNRPALKELLADCPGRLSLSFLCDMTATDWSEQEKAVMALGQ